MAGVIVDLHIHSKYSRATSKALSFENLVKYAKIKGVDILGTGDFTHPEYFKEIKRLKEKNGLYYYKDFPFVITGEISLMYSQGRGRRVHLVVLVPSIEIAEKINSYLDTIGRRDYDGRPIFSISCIEFTKKMMEISKDIEIIPAHCLLPDSFIHVRDRVKKIKDIKKGEKVLTHEGNFKEVKEIFIHPYNGEIYKIIPWYFREGLEATPEHPFYVVRSYKNCPSIKGLCKPLCSQIKKGCAKKYFERYYPEWVMAKDIGRGDFLVYPRLKWQEDIEEIDLINYINNYKIIKNQFIISKNARNHTGKIKRKIKVDEQFCRLMGYFLSEGYLIKDSAIGFSFHNKEKEYIKEVSLAIKDCFGFEISSIDSRRENQADLIFYSKLLNSFFRNFYLPENKRANNKIILSNFINLSENKLAEIFIGWWRGDTGSTVSRQLANQMKIICLKLGIIPSISIDTIESHKKRGKHFIEDREIIANNDLIIFSNLSFFEKDYGMLKESCFKKFVNKRKMKHGWIDKKHIYLPVRKIEIKEYRGEVYNLEVEGDNSYVSEFACVHNCWTPWFGILGSKSGFDSIKEAFGGQIENIHAIETGLSSDPPMNWRIKELDKFAILSFSDSHSFWPWRIGREATIFSEGELSYKKIINDIRNNKIEGTIEVDPAYGMYHWDGHRNCSFSSPPSKTKELNGICPVCKTPLTIGVDYRVEELADSERKQGFKPDNAKKFYKILPLHEIISLFSGSGMASKGNWDIYNSLIEKFGNEFNILLKVSKEELLKNEVKEKLAELIIKNREGKIKVNPGYDGKYGEAVIVEQKTLF